MVSRSQSEKAKRFLELHHSKKILLLPNIWNPIGARILQSEGYPAAATASAAISAMYGYMDSERIKLSTLTDLLSRISASVDIPISADFEKGYANSISELKDSVREIINTGIVGINIEDSNEEDSELVSISEQCERINTIREVSEQNGIHLVINARTDVFLLKSQLTGEERIETSAQRLTEYIKAGADSVYPVGTLKRESILELRKRVSAPINILGSPSALPLTELQQIGINRVSFGPFIFRSCMKKFEKITKELQQMSSYNCFSDEMLTYADISGYLSDAHEK